MSSTNLKNFLKNVLIPDLNASVEKGARSARKTLTKADENSHQFFIVDKDLWWKELDHITAWVNKKKKLTPNERVDLDDDQKRTLWGKYFKNLKKEENIAKKGTRGAFLFSRIWMVKSGEFPLKKPLPPKAVILVVRHMEIVKKIKQQLGWDFLDIVKDNLKKSNKFVQKTTADQIRYKLTGAQQVDYGYQHGHGEFGEAAAEVRLARAQALVAGFKGSEEDKEKLEKLVTVSYQDDDQNDHVLEHELIFDVLPNGDLKLKDDYMTLLSLQLTGDNQSDSVAEQQAIEAVETNAEELFLAEGSTRITDAIAMIFMSALVNKTRKVPKVKVTFPGRQPKRRIKEKGRGRANAKLKIASSLVVGQSGIYNKKVLNTISKKVGTSGSRSNKASSSRGGMSPLSLISLINSKLPEQVVSNMGAPALENRTGRFAGSAVVTNVVPSKMGSVIQYTYQRSPYQVFEGGPKSDGGNRDPRKLLDLSIREIAAKTMMSKFTTQRV